jgi:hypothetical protein
MFIAIAVLHVGWELSLRPLRLRSCERRLRFDANQVAGWCVCAVGFAVHFYLMFKYRMWRSPE